MNTSVLKDKLLRAERLARGGKWVRLFNNPVKYIATQFYNKFIYSSNKGDGWTRHSTVISGHRMELRLPAGTDLYLTGAKSHDSEIRLARYFINRLQSGHSVLDIGAHYGYFTLLASSIIGETGKVLCIEAAPSTFQLLLRNTEQVDNIQSQHIAISDVDTSVSFYEFPTAYSEYNSMNIEQYKNESWLHSVDYKEHQMEALRIDTICSRESFIPELIKIDVEGLEDKVVQGLTGLIDRGIYPILCMEYLSEDRSNMPHRSAAAFLVSHGYSCHIINGDGHLSEITPEGIASYLNEQGLDSDNIVFARH